MLIAEIYWDWKGLITNAMALLLPIVAYSATNRKVIQYMLSYYIRYVLPLFVIFALILRADAYGFYLIPMSFLLLFFPVMTMRQKILMLAVTFVVKPQIWVPAATSSNLVFQYLYWDSITCGACSR